MEPGGSDVGLVPPHAASKTTIARPVPMIVRMARIIGGASSTSPCPRPGGRGIMPVAVRISAEDAHMTDDPDLAIEPLTPDRLADLAACSRRAAIPKWCWCAYFRVRGTDFSSGSKARHRSVLEAAATDGPAAGPRARPRRLRGRRGGRLDQHRAARRLRAPRPFQGPRARRRHAGLVDRLLRRRAASTRPRHRQDACSTPASRTPATTAPPRSRPIRSRSRRASGSRPPIVFRGTLTMFERAGFTVVARRQWNASTPVRPIVRLDLGGGPGPS